MIADIDPNDPKKILISEFEYRYKEILASLPTSSYKAKDNSWRLNLTWQTCLALQTTFGSVIRIGPALQKWTSETYNNLILPAYNMRNLDSCDLGEKYLFPHQRADVQFLAHTRRALLANDMGSGKSISALAGIKELFGRGEEVFPMLIACPNSTKFSWAKEIPKVMKGLSVSVIDGTAAQRKKQFASGADVYIINWESLRSHSRLQPYGSTALKRCVDCGGFDEKVKPASCEVHVKELNEIEFKSVIGDEIHRIIDPDSKMAKAFKAATGDADIRVALSGTPISKTPYDLFSIFNWLYPEAFPSRTKFRDRFFISTKNAFNATVIVGVRPEMEQEFFGGIMPFLRRMPKELILKFLPPIIRERRDVQLGAKQLKAYNGMKNDMLAELDNDHTVVTTNNLTRNIRLLQFASSYAEMQVKSVYNEETFMVEDKLSVILSEPSATLDAFMEDIPDFGEESVIVFTVSKQLLYLLSARMEKAGIKHGIIVGGQDNIERQKHMDDFQAGKTKFILVTTGAGGTGITLTKGSIMAFLQRPWSMIENGQAEARGHRIGSEQHESVKIIDYVVRGTVQEKVFEAVEMKLDNLDYILRDKELMKKFLNNELTFERKGEDDGSNV